MDSLVSEIATSSRPGLAVRSDLIKLSNRLKKQAQRQKRARCSQIQASPPTPQTSLPPSQLHDNQELFWTRSALTEWGSIVADPEVLMQRIQLQVIDVVRLSKTINILNAELHPPEWNVGLCGACGIKDFGKFDILTTSDLDKLRVDPQSECSTFHNIITDHHGQRFHLHSGSSGPIFLACASCLHAIRTKNEVPPLSLAAGFDFGNVSSLPALSEIEILLISRVILFSYIYTISPEGQTGFKGHSIAFPSSGPETFVSRLPNLLILDQITVIFKGSKNALRRQSLHSFFQVRPNVVYFWLNTLKSVNPLYHDIEIQSFDLCLFQEKIFSRITTSDEDDSRLGHNDRDGSDTPSDGDLNNVDPVLLNVTRGQDPLCEFDNNDRIILLSFPHLFLFGKGIPNKGSLSQKFINHLLFQFDGRFATDSRLIFLLFNQKQRHLVARSVGKRLTHHGMQLDVLNSNAGILNIMKDPGFEEALCSARSTGKFPPLLQPLLNHMNLSSASLPLSSGEAKMNVSRLIAMIHYFGLPSWWMTISPPEFSNALSLRLAHKSSEISVIEITSLAKVDRCRLSATNPVAIARGFSHLLKNLVEHLFHLPLWNVRKTRSKNMEAGIFGTLQSYFIVIESQARGSLHAHALLWGCVPPKVIQQVMDRNEVRSALNSMLDSMIRAYFPLEVHATESVRLEAKLPPTSTFLHPTPCPLRNPEQFWNHYYQAAAPTHIHLKYHAPTCHKGKAGRYSCRMGFPQGTFARTNFVELNEQDGQISTTEPQSLVRTSCPTDIIDSLNPDRRVIIWELMRPFDPDTWVVSHSPILAAVTGGNTHATPLGSLTQALSIIYYLTDYMCKSVQELNVITDSIREVRKRMRTSEEPVAESSLLQRLINNLHGSQEISGQLASYILLGNDSWHTPEIFWTIYPLPAVRQVIAAHQCSHSNYVDSPFTEDSDEEDEFDIGDPSSSEEEVADNLDFDIPEDSSQKIYSSIHQNAHGEDILISPQDHYRWRGRELQHLCFYEYFGMIAVVPISARKRGGEDASVRLNLAGRRENPTFLFSSAHPLVHSHQQTLRSKMAVPLISGCIPRQARELAAFMLTLFVPWEEDCFIIPGGIGIAAFRSYLNRSSSSSSGSSIDRGKLQLIENIIQSRAVSSRAKKLIAKWRHRCTIPWNSESAASSSGRSFGMTTGTNAIFEEDFDEIGLLAALEELNRLKSRPNDSTGAVQGFLSRQKSCLEKCFPLRLSSIESTPRHIANPIDAICTIPFPQVIEASLAITGAPDLPSSNTSSSSSSSSLTHKMEQLNDEQRKIYSSIMSKTKQGVQHLSFLQGGPGVGKTFLSALIIESIVHLGRKVAVCAPTGIAASHLPQGMTINALFSIPCRKNREMLAQPLSLKSLEKLRKRLQKDELSLIVIDEISMVTCEMIDSIDQRLRQVFQTQSDFGGISVLAVGDFYQLKPACGTPLYGRVSATSHKLAAIHGWNLFFKFDLYDLKTQVRSKDPLHTQRLAMMKTRCNDTIHDMCVLSTKDELEFLNATILVASNQERLNLNLYMAKRFAVQSGQPILRWRKTISQQLSQKLTTADIQKLYDNDDLNELHCFFIRHAPAYLSENISPENGIANGTPVTLDSISIDPTVLTDELMMKIANGRPGEIVDIPPPSFVNVITQYNGKWVPVGVSKIVKQAKAMLKIPYFRHGFELGFVITFHKSQGMTLSRVLLDLNSRTGCAGKLGQLSWHSLYVALSRVEHSHHIRILEPHSSSAFRYLDTLRPSPLLLDWFRDRQKSSTFLSDD